MFPPEIPSQPGHTLRLRLRVGAAGPPIVRGILRVADGDRVLTLVAERGGTQASCADVDGNGVPGLARLAFVARDRRTGKRMPITLTTAERDDIDRAGRYVVALRVGGVERNVALAVRALPRRRR